MKMLCERILSEGKVLPGGILKVDSFMNHQIDPILMKQIGEEFARRFASFKPTRILTAETSGIAPALSAAMKLEVPLVFARKHKPKTMVTAPLRETTISATHGNEAELLVSPEYLERKDRVLILDDFLSSARTILALVGLVEQSGAQLVGVGAVIEKCFAGGRAALTHVKCPVESLAEIDRLDGEEIILR